MNKLYSSNEYTFEQYTLHLTDHPDKRCTTKLEPATGMAQLPARRKIYLVHTATEILYVGEAHSAIKTRLQRGSVSFNRFVMTGVAKGGYKGYKWLNNKENEERKLKVSVAVFGEEYDDKSKRPFIEAIEGELVFLIRQETGKWPKCQQEIHFSNEPGAFEIAQHILKKIKASSADVTMEELQTTEA